MCFGSGLLPWAPPPPPPPTPPPPPPPHPPPPCSRSFLASSSTISLISHRCPHLNPDLILESIFLFLYGNLCHFKTDCNSCPRRQALFLVVDHSSDRVLPACFSGLEVFYRDIACSGVTPNIVFSPCRIFPPSVLADSFGAAKKNLLLVLLFS